MSREVTKSFGKLPQRLRSGGGARGCSHLLVKDDRVLQRRAHEFVSRIRSGFAERYPVRHEPQSSLGTEREGRVQ
jgi:hypothetical protein